MTATLTQVIDGIHGRAELDGSPFLVIEQSVRIMRITEVESDVDVIHHTCPPLSPRNMHCIGSVSAAHRH